MNENPFAASARTRIIVGLPHLSDGALLRKAESNGWPVMVSASSLAKWETIEHRGQRARQWKAWNKGPLDRLLDRSIEIHLDSAGFVAMALRGGYDWTPESYVHDLASHPAIHRFSSMDMCVEPEIAPDRMEVRERIARTIALNHRCAAAARDAGCASRMMPVIQGVNASDYLRCYEAISSVIPAHGTIGVGSMCRRRTGGEEGSIAIVEALDRELPPEITLHLFGVKSDSYEAMAMFGNRVASVDSQSYGTRARCIANERRKTEPEFSKTDEFVASVMASWHAKQSARFDAPRQFERQVSLALDTDPQPRTVLDAAIMRARHQISNMIEGGGMDHDTVIGPRMLEEWTADVLQDITEGVMPTDPWKGEWQLPDMAA